MGNRMRFKFLNIPVQISPSFWIFLLFFTNIYQDPSLEAVILGIVLILSLLVHEYGHAMTAYYFGKSPEITLEAFGGNAKYNNYGITPKQKFLITLNGPLFESFLIVLSYYFLKQNFFENHYIRFFLYATMRLNILWCLFNLIPLKPLDGGHLLHYFLEKKFGEKGEKICAVIGISSAVALAPYFYFQNLFFFSIFLGILAFQEFRKFKQLDDQTSPFTMFMKGSEAMRNQNLNEAAVIFKKLIKTKDSQIKISSIENLAQIYYQTNNHKLSYQLLLNSDQQSLKESKCLLCQLAYEQKNYELVSQYANDIYNIRPTKEIALLNSKAYAHLNNPELSGGWLKTALLFGDLHIEEIIKDSSYDTIREEEAFREEIKDFNPVLV